MKQKSTASPVITKEDIQRMLRQFGMELRESLRNEFREEFRKYKDHSDTRFDDIVGQLGTLRDEMVINIYHTRETREQVDEHEKRISRLEKIQHHA